MSSSLFQRMTNIVLRGQASELVRILNQTPKSWIQKDDLDYMLELAVSNSNPEKTEILLNYGANPNRSRRGATPLPQSIWQDSDIRVIQLLLQAGADPNDSGIYSQLPLQFAINDDRLEIADLLLQYGADPYLKNKDGRDSYYVARGKPEFIELMDSYVLPIKEPAEDY